MLHDQTEREPTRIVVLSCFGYYDYRSFLGHAGSNIFPSVVAHTPCGRFSIEISAMQTKGNHGQGFSRLMLVLIFLFHTAVTAQTGQQQPESPSFWDRVKTGAKQGVARSQLGSGGQRGSRSLSNQIVNTQHQGPIFESLDPATRGRFEGLFAGDDHAQAQLGRLQWPRAAITFVEYGASLPCWTARARIWTSAKSSHTETFKVCESAITQTDDAGRGVTLNESSVLYLNSRMRGVRAMSTQNTGTQRTEGPNPPLEPWAIKLGRDNSGAPDLGRQLAKILPRLAWASGYLTDADVYRGSQTIATGFQDARMWFAGFDPTGNADVRGQP